MKSPILCNNDKNGHAKGQAGFTLIEILVVLGLIAILLGFGLFFDFDNFRAYSFRSERDTLVTVLHHARAEAMANICRGDSCSDGLNHGIKITDDDFVIFQSEAGEEYDPDDTFNAPIGKSGKIEYGGIDEVIFTRLSGDVLEPGEITLEDKAGHSSTITIGSEGQITWTD